MSAHDWIASGRMDDGSQRWMCAICEHGQHWPGVGAMCGGQLGKPGRGKKAPPVRFPRQVGIVDDVPPNRSCAICGNAYHSMHRRSRYCSPPCSRAAWLRQNDAAYRARRAKLASSALVLTEEDGTEWRMAK